MKARYGLSGVLSYGLWVVCGSLERDLAFYMWLIFLILAHELNEAKSIPYIAIFFSHISNCNI